MVNIVVLSSKVKRQLIKLPVRIAAKLRTWVSAVEVDGLENVRKLPGYHDEPLRGKRKGQRSIRLSIHYRAIYEIRSGDEIEFVSVEEVNKHDYKKK
jgi:proteic killer suppression protein